VRLPHLAYVRTFRPRNTSTISAYRLIDAQSAAQVLSHSVCVPGEPTRLRPVILLLAIPSIPIKPIYPESFESSEPITTGSPLATRAFRRVSFVARRGIARSDIPPAIVSLCGNPRAKVNFRDPARRIARRRIFPFLCTLQPLALQPRFRVIRKVGRTSYKWRFEEGKM